MGKTLKYSWATKEAILDNFNAILFGETLYKLIQLLLEIEL